jgi:hypothetical protein
MPRKWGESFLKSGLPLEYLTAATLQASGWSTSFHFEYQRPNADGDVAWFEVDLSARRRKSNAATRLELPVECKYHDTDRFWFFHPLAVSEHTADSDVVTHGAVPDVSRA